MGKLCFFCNVSNVGSLAASKTDLFGLHGNCLDPSPNTAMVEMLKRGPCFKRFEGYNIKKYLYGSKVHTSWVFAISSNVTREKFPLSSMISSKKTSKLLVTMRRESHLGDQCRILILSADKYADGLFGFYVIQRVYIYKEMRQHHWRGFRIMPCKGLQVSDFGPYCLKKCLRIICLRRSAELRFRGIRWAQSDPNHKIKVRSHLKVKTPCLMAKSTSVIVKIVCSDVLFVDKLML